MRFFDLILKAYGQPNAVQDWNGFSMVNHGASKGTITGHKVLMQWLLDPETRRILFDCRQAALFWEAGGLPPENVQATLIPPYEHFYLEFTEPVQIAEYQAEHIPTTLRAILVRKMPVYLGEQAAMEYPLNVVIFLDRPDRRTESHSVSLDLAFGNGVAFAGPLMATEEPSWYSAEDEVEDFIMAGDGESRALIDTAGRVPIDSLVRIRSYDCPRMGRVEKALAGACGLVSWVIAYMMAKSIEVVSESLPRQQRRNLARQGKVHPWHVVRVKPELVAGKAGVGTGEGTRHGHQYDVMGHLRFGKHKRKDGTYSETVEWVPPHRRGLANDLYIPKVGRFDAGYEAHPAMEQWWGRTEEGK